MNYNRVNLGGRLVNKPELRNLPSGTPAASFTIAVTRVWYKEEEKQEETGFFDCEAFGKKAEVIAQYFDKGKPIFVDGRLRQDKWESKEGDKRSKVIIIVEDFQFIGGDKKSEESDKSTPPTKTTKQQNRKDIPF